MGAVSTPEEPNSVDSLVRRCVRGDREAQRALFQRLRGPVHATLFRILGNNRDFPDLAQDSFVEIFRSLHAFRGDSQITTWSDIITARVAYKYLARRERRPDHLRLVEDDDRAGSSAEAVERRSDAREAMRRLYRILDRLEPIYRIAYALHVIDGRPLSEVAVLTEATRVAAKNRVWRARKMVARRARRDPYLSAFLQNEGEPA